MTKTRLTQTAQRAGCAAKHPASYLLPLLEGLPDVEDPNVLVGTATSDDAGVYKLTDEVAVVTTTDFFTPIVDDPYDFGMVGAANALSDVYAMGGRPVCVLNLVGFPATTLEPEVLGEVLRGGADKVREAEAEVVGGHTIHTDEPIYGLAVTGTVHPDRIITNATAKAGDYLVLTKPLGIGIVATAAKQGADEQGAIADAIAVMRTLNRSASEAMSSAGAHAATDVTGFGLLGHLRNMLVASQLGATVWLDSVPVMGAARQYAEQGIAPGGTHKNHRFLAEAVDYAAGVPESSQLLLCDAQTSGGLLIAVDPSEVDALIRELERRETLAASIIGRLDEGEPGRLHVKAART